MRTTVRDTEGVSSVAGRVLSTGVIQAGTGFVVSKAATGQYLIRIPRSVGLVHVAVTPDASSVSSSCADVGTFTADTFTVYTSTTSTGAAVDIGFFLEAKHRT
jgi:hypothetical protein